jgi:hypothetical protein
MNAIILNGLAEVNLFSDNPLRYKNAYPFTLQSYSPPDIHPGSTWGPRGLTPGGCQVEAGWMQSCDYGRNEAFMISETLESGGN